MRVDCAYRTYISFSPMMQCVIFHVCCTSTSWQRSDAAKIKKKKWYNDEDRKESLPSSRYAGNSSYKGKRTHRIIPKVEGWITDIIFLHDSDAIWSWTLFSMFTLGPGKI